MTPKRDRQNTELKYSDAQKQIDKRMDPLIAEARSIAEELEAILAHVDEVIAGFSERRAAA